MMEELARYRCIGDDGTRVAVVEYRYVHLARSSTGTRRHLGATKLTLETGEPVRYIDEACFEVIDSGELIRRIS
ncbi:hypothetical protein [Sphingomonas colocasiae]|uniref:Uncharacterized protein n=1 Tax=Sphingomonas colocasiae TaxID=1848973 RepID=A0ABS7PP84_9SPHN|nr:hypothetical protein [Sphingomonas colocasiae]MBY8822814.1 hypothetical protein [Sphingomonas colocasiae]